MLVFVWGGGNNSRLNVKELGESLKLIRTYRRTEERLNQSLLRRRANLGHVAKLARSGRFISSMKYHYFAFVSWHIVNQVPSAFNPPPHAAVPSLESVTNTWTSQCTGGRWIPARVKGYVALPWQVWLKRFQSRWELFSKCRLRVFTCKLQTHSEALFLCASPINQLPERKTPWPGLILLSREGGEVCGRSAPLSNLPHVPSSCFAWQQSESADWSA